MQDTGVLREALAEMEELLRRRLKSYQTKHQGGVDPLLLNPLNTELSRLDDLIRRVKKELNSHA